MIEGHPTNKWANIVPCEQALKTIVIVFHLKKNCVLLLAYQLILAVPTPPPEISGAVFIIVRPRGWGAFGRLMILTA